jgi:D-sedoheptulose 7-phosphate isomerase
MKNEFIQKQLQASINVKEKILENDALISMIGKVANKCIDALSKGQKILLAGNGGSAADAQHIAAELVSQYEFKRTPLPAMALTTDTSILTAISNDYGYEQLFARQLQANAVKGDIFIGISTSGNSPNVLQALQYARISGIITIGMTGARGDNMTKLCELCIKIPSISTPRIQEAHITIGHILCGMIENTIYGRKNETL